MRNIIRFFIASIFLAMGGVSTSTVFSQSSLVHISLSLPTESLSLADLDVRDEFNRPIRSVQARRQLENIFTNSLLNLVSHNLTPSKQSLLKLLSYSWDHSHGWLTRTFHQSQLVQIIWMNKKKFYGPTLVSTIVNVDNQIQRSGTVERNTRNSFNYLISYILSSTILLR